TVENPLAKATAHLFVKNIGGAKRTLVLTGPVGTRKTSLSIALGRELIATHGMQVRYVKHRTYLEKLRPDPQGESNTRIRLRYKKCPALVLDDLAADLDPTSKATEFVRAETIGLIGDRANAG